MTDKDTMPTPGKWTYQMFDAEGPDDPECFAHIWADGDGGSAIATLQGWDGRDVEPDAALIAAVGTAAHEVKQMGFDPVEAVKALPSLIAALKEIAETSDDLCAEGFDLHDVAALGSEARNALTRAAGKEGESHE